MKLSIVIEMEQFTELVKLYVRETRPAMADQLALSVALEQMRSLSFQAFLKWAQARENRDV